VAVTHALIGLQTQSLEASIPVNAKVLYSGNEIRPFKRLSEAQLLAKAETHTLAADEKKKLADFLKSMNNAPEYKPGIIYTTEYCIRTHNIIAEPKVSECSICDCNEVGCGCKDETPTPVNP
jgi:hypothetical protein